MRSFAAANAAYEAAMRDRFGDALVAADLARKHKKMRGSAFLFLRGTCFRWAEAAAELCPELAAAPRVPSVGDAHAGNFGLWRDEGARLVWGINDYDEAARLPYPLDLVRLGASILLAAGSASARDVAAAALAGYRDALARPAPFVLERRHDWLREAFAAAPDQREAFWQELDDAAPAAVPPALGAPLVAALPPVAGLRLAARVAGVGSLGRPRFVASGQYRGGPVAAEIKGAMPSCWTQAREDGIAARMAGGRWRSPDPSLIHAAGHVLRRLAPDSRKLDFEKVGDRLQARLIGAMAAELAAIHLTEDAADAVAGDLAARPPAWLAEAVARVADWTEREYSGYSAA